MFPQSTQARVHEQDKAGKPERGADELNPAEPLLPEPQPDRDRPQRHRIGEHDRASWRHQCEPEDAANQESGDLEQPNQEKAGALAAERNQRLPHRKEGRRQQGQRAGHPQQDEQQRRRVRQRQLHQRPVAGPGDDDDREVEIDGSRRRGPCIYRLRRDGCASFCQ